jgi:hypothetical protein
MKHEEKREEEEERSGEVVRDITFGGNKKERIYISGFEGSQAVPARPSVRGSAYCRNYIYYYYYYYYY